MEISGFLGMYYIHHFHVDCHCVSRMVICMFQSTSSSLHLISSHSEVRDLVSSSVIYIDCTELPVNASAPTTFILARFPKPSHFVFHHRWATIVSGSLRAILAWRGYINPLPFHLFPSYFFYPQPSTIISRPLCPHDNLNTAIYIHIYTVPNLPSCHLINTWFLLPRISITIIMKAGGVLLKVCLFASDGCYVQHAPNSWVDLFTAFPLSSDQMNIKD